MSDAPNADPADTPDTADGKTFSAEYVADLRAENARRRVEAKDAVEAARTETRAEVVTEYEPQLAEKDTQIAALTADLSAAQADNLKLRAVLAADGVEAADVLELVDLVQGTDEAGITSSLERVLKVYGKRKADSAPTPRATDPSQGSGGDVVPLNGNGVVNMLKAAVGAR
ncbi:hypothetical protein A5630_23100 [Mycolicibacterium mucogenicum]|uniref:Scaffolding protein n=1 Tax=Mycolicibacterium mucogenicum TaxID=56689 RepID=A0A1A3GZV1_MYCMU|nr:hypothetical protein [Mycolicibacterium mucogenicum]OBJ41330.1 hypothetical protein A5630_23100 [Mycolicibacterium mucogenicum]